MTKVLFTPQNQLRPHDVHTQTLCLCHVAPNESFDEAQASASQHPARLQPSRSICGMQTRTCFCMLWQVIDAKSSAASSVKTSGTADLCGILSASDGRL